MSDPIERGKKPIELSEQHMKWLLWMLARNLRFQSPTAVKSAAGELDRINVTLHASDYEKLLMLLELDDRFRLPQSDEFELKKQFAAKARTAGGAYDLSTWSMGELAVALDDTAGITELADFHSAAQAEMQRRMS
jgi:hypothetical protein